MANELSKIQKQNKSYKIGQSFYKSNTPEVIDEIINKINILFDEIKILKEKIK